ncbi:MAG: hypothetical protein IKT27_06315 [Clostridia bacterium]|nr:hypothetical protein [Clostridia bacterium]
MRWRTLSYSGRAGAWRHAQKHGRAVVANTATHTGQSREREVVKTPHRAPQGFAI